MMEIKTGRGAAESQGATSPRDKDVDTETEALGG